MATHFLRYPNVGALTGELTVQRPYRTFLTAVQFCEWKVSHLLQKPVESICGFLTVLPGAFCAFRWAAVEVSRHGWLVVGKGGECCDPACLPANLSPCSYTPDTHIVCPPPSLLQGEPLRKYFYGLYSQAELNAFEANMFLAEDRILCIEVVAKKVGGPWAGWLPSWLAAWPMQGRGVLKQVLNAQAA